MQCTSGDNRLPLFLGEAALHKVDIPRATCCLVVDRKVAEWPARIGAAESPTPTPTPTHILTSLDATNSTLRFQVGRGAAESVSE
jgi:hypothetical protein